MTIWTRTIRILVVRGVRVCVQDMLKNQISTGVEISRDLEAQLLEVLHTLSQTHFPR